GGGEQRPTQSEPDRLQRGARRAASGADRLQRRDLRHAAGPGPVEGAGPVGARLLRRQREPGCRAAAGDRRAHHPLHRGCAVTMVNETSGRIRIASRGSPLALWQANAVRDALVAANADLLVEIKVVRTTGDRVTDAPLSKIGDRGLFTKEVDGAVLEGEADIAVHSLKDVPTRITDGLALVAVTERADPRDVLIGPAGSQVTIDGLAPGARV